MNSRHIVRYFLSLTLLIHACKSFHLHKTYERIPITRSPVPSQRLSMSSHEETNTSNTPEGSYSSQKKAQTLKVKLSPGVKTISREAWGALTTQTTSPFMEYDWFYCLEESGVASTATGWQPLHITVSEENSDNLVAAVPMYVKYHSMGEFIFDNAWADAAYNYFGVEYYPKLLCAVPMTPASGERILMQSNQTDQVKAEIQRVVAATLKQLTQSNGLSSVHVNFCEEKEALQLETSGFMTRSSLQYHWQNSNPNNEGKPFKSFDEYLSCFPSKKRIKMKRERKSVYEDAGVKIDVYQGETIPDDLFPVLFRIYKSTIDKLMYGRQYLNENFFVMLSKYFKRNLCFIVARDGATGDILAGTFNIVKAGRFYGRYWGGFQFVKNLHFETCYYKAIEYCIQNGLAVMEPGAGGGDFKFMRGFDPVIIKSSHFIVNNGLNLAVKEFLRKESKGLAETTDFLNEQSPMKTPKPKTAQIKAN